MTGIVEMLDNAKKSRSLASDNALAGQIGATRQAVSGWRKGKSLPDAVFTARLADMAGIPLHQAIGLIGEARAISREEKAVWRRLATAAVLVVALLPFSALIHAKAETGHGAGGPVLCKI